MLIAKSYHNTHKNESYDSLVYTNEVIIKLPLEQLTLDVFDIKSLIETLFLAFNPIQQKNMIKILTLTKGDNS